MTAPLGEATNRRVAKLRWFLCGWRNGGRERAKPAGRLAELPARSPFRSRGRQIAHAERLQALAPVADVDGTVAAHRHAERRGELAGVVPEPPKCGQEPSFVVEDLHTTVRVVGHEHAPRRVHRRVHGPDELAFVEAILPPPIEELALRGEALHAVVVELGDQQRAIGIEADPERSDQLPRLRAVRAPLGEVLPVGIEDLHGAGPRPGGSAWR